MKFARSQAESGLRKEIKMESKTALSKLLLLLLLLRNKEKKKSKLAVHYRSEWILIIVFQCSQEYTSHLQKI